MSLLLTAGAHCEAHHGVLTITAKDIPLHQKSPKSNNYGGPSRNNSSFGKLRILAAKNCRPMSAILPSSVYNRKLKCGSNTIITMLHVRTATQLFTLQRPDTFPPLAARANACCPIVCTYKVVVFSWQVVPLKLHAPSLAGRRAVHTIQYGPVKKKLLLLCIILYLE